MRNKRRSCWGRMAAKRDDQCNQYSYANPLSHCLRHPWPLGVRCGCSSEPQMEPYLPNPKRKGGTVPRLRFGLGYFHLPLDAKARTTDIRKFKLTQIFRIGATCHRAEVSHRSECPDDSGFDEKTFHCTQVGSYQPIQSLGLRGHPFTFLLSL